jgi:hypothetical protein
LLALEKRAGAGKVATAWDKTSDESQGFFLLVFFESN